MSELTDAQLRAQKRQERLLAKGSDRLAKLTGGSGDRIVSDLGAYRYVQSDRRLTLRYRQREDSEEQRQ